MGRLGHRSQKFLNNKITKITKITQIVKFVSRLHSVRVRSLLWMRSSLRSAPRETKRRLFGIDIPARDQRLPRRVAERHRKFSTADARPQFCVGRLWLIVQLALVCVCSACSDDPNVTSDSNASTDVGGLEDVADAGPDVIEDTPVDSADDVTDDSDIVDTSDPDRADDVPFVPDFSLDVPLPDGVGCSDSPILSGQLWPDGDRLTNPDTLNLQVVREFSELVQGRRVDIQELRYSSWEVFDCELTQIRIHAFYALPNNLRGGASEAGVVVAHDIGQCADATTAAGWASRLNAGVLFFSGPGSCSSSGRDDSTLFETSPDPRTSWAWSQAVAASRGLTVLETLPETDPARLGMLGFGFGGVATLNTNGFDARLRAVFSFGAAGAFDVALASGSWLSQILSVLEVAWPIDSDDDDDRFANFVDFIDPLQLADNQYGSVLMSIGTADEFFTLDSVMTTFDQFSGTDHRLVVLPRRDHGIWETDLDDFGICDAWNADDRAGDQIDRLARYWFGFHLGTDTRYQSMAPTPSLDFDAEGEQIALSSTFETDYDVLVANVYLSSNGSATYLELPLSLGDDAAWVNTDSGFDSEAYNADISVVFSRFDVRVGLSDETGFPVTSLPLIPEAYEPVITDVAVFSCP